MKKLGLFLIMMLAVLIVPFSVLADEAENGDEAEVTESEGTSEEDKRVKVYFFRGEGCPHCADAEEWFESIQEEYGSKYQIVDYEVWKNEDNAELMDRVSEARDDGADGVPYIIIGNHSWNGFAEDYEIEILEAIDAEYEKEPSSRYDIMELLPDIEKEKKEESKSSDIVTLIIIILVVGGVAYGVVQARKKTY